ncbi:hypothetical protein WJX73_004777 [Symbiochloris irregularis]|uniref:Uncharacterized protein n=1 Tax=Symbiochloris irregularis TaxID=706552 RepID=A0AAW1PDX7_9CHLO
MAGGHHGDHHNVTYEGLSLHKASSWHVNAAKGFGGLMWFWIFYRFYHDYDTFLFGHAPHFEHELHEEAHGHVEKGQAAAHH